MSPWKWMFIVIAAATVFWSILLVFALPTSQATAKFLTEEEKVAAVEMVRDNNTGIHNRTFIPSQAKEALLDPKTYIFFWFAFFGNLPNSVSTVSSLFRYLRAIADVVDVVWKHYHIFVRIFVSPYNTCRWPQRFQKFSFDSC